MPSRPLYCFLAVVLLLLSAPGAKAAETAGAPALDPKVGLNAYAAVVDQEFERARAGLLVLAATENAAAGDWDRIKGPLAVFAGLTPINAAVWFARPDGSYFTVESGLTDQSLKDRDYFPALMAGQEVNGALVVSKSTGRRSAVVAVPVKANGRVVGAIGVSIAMETVGALVDEKIGLPKSVVFYALDRRGKTALHRDPKRLLEFAAELGSPSLADAVKEMLAKSEGEVRYAFEGAERTAIFRRSTVTGWVYALRW